MLAGLRTLVIPVAGAFFYQVKANLASTSVMIIWIFSPVIIGSMAALFYRSAHASDLIVYAVLGSVVTGIWTTSLFLSAITLGNDRWSGVLELMMATPARMAQVMVGKLIATASQGLLAGLVAVVAVSVASRTVIDVDRPLVLVASLPFAVLGVGCFALLLSPMLFVTRGVVGMFAILDAGVTALSAVLYPVSVLPHWLQVASKASTLRWSATALVRSADGSSGSVVEAWTAIVLLSAIYALVAVALYELLERRVRRTGELSTF